MTAKCRMLTQALALELLRYEPETGKLFWRQRDRRHFVSQRGFKVWNARYAGAEAFTALADGYRVGNLLDCDQRAHRVIWLMVHGYWPVEIDHIDGDRANNRLTNLREATSSINKRNRARQSNNTSGVTGVIFDKVAGKWAARIKFDGRVRHLGFFEDIADAAIARQQAMRELGFTERHGKAA